MIQIGVYHFLQEITTVNMSKLPSLRRDEIQERVVTCENYFRRACSQIVFLNNRLNAITLRYTRAKEQKRKSFRYSLRLRLAVVEGLRNMYYDFAKVQAIEIKKLKAELDGHIIDEISDDGESTDIYSED